VEKLKPSAEKCTQPAVSLKEVTEVEVSPLELTTLIEAEIGAEVNP
jgi:hypothetical protein